MFNIYNFEKKQKCFNEVQKNKEQFVVLKNKRRKQLIQMSNNYQKRVDNFMQNVNEKPIEINRFQCTDYDHFKFRHAYNIQKDMKFKKPSEQKLKRQNADYYDFKQDHYMRTEGDSNGQSQYYQSQIRFRQREKEKEIQPDMKFTPKTDMERIRFHLQENVQTQVSNENMSTFYKKQKSIEQSASKQSQRKKNMQCSQHAKGILPELHTKTHFKAIQQLMSQDGLNLSPNHNMFRSQKEYKNSQDFTSTHEISQIVLEKCQFSVPKKRD